jgi:ankyrin repeat protein
MAEDRIISENTIGNGNVFFQGNVSVNNHAQGSQKQAEHDVLKRLYTSPYQDRKDRNPPRVPGTCDWFVSHEHFRTWNKSNSSALLWVSADPGCGKSVLVRHLVDSVVHTTESRAVCYFFFKDDFPDQKNIISALSCILRQIFIQRPSLLSDEILGKFNSGGETFATSFSELWKTLMQVAKSEHAGEIVCILDAIDECEDQSGQGRSELLKALCTLYETNTRRNSNLKFLLTSRPYAEISRGLQPVQVPELPVIRLSGESEDEIKKISLEINIYIDARVHDIANQLQLTQNECDLLLRKLKSVPNRTYLWVYLVLNYIENSISLSNKMIIEATLNMPTTVNEAYERILSKSTNAKQARKILHIIVAAARPLTLGEMNFALALDNGDQQSYDDLGLAPDNRFRETLRNICGLCVVVVDSSVYLLHQTVKEFLVKADDMQTIGRGRGDLAWEFSLSLLESHRILAEICIWHLVAGLKMTPDSPTHDIWDELFLDYSARHWASHFHQMPIEIQSIMTESILMICDVASGCCQTWFTRYWATTHTEFPLGFTTLMMASYFGLHFAVRSLLSMPDIELDTLDSTYLRSALCWAARNGFHLVAKLLLNGIREKLGTLKLPFKKKSKVDLQDKYGRTPLTYAIWNGDVTLVQLLIKARARANVRDELDGTPLSYAFCNGNAEIINLLAKRKRVVDIENDINRLLLSAAERGHEEVMSLLLKTNRANIEAQDPDGRTPLLIAIEKRHITIVKLLLEAGADVNAHKDDGFTALIYASKWGYEAIVQLLLEAGADVNAHEDNGSTALIYASNQGYEAIVQLLLEAGADVNAHKDDGFTALIYASGGGHEAIVQLLLEAGADVNAHSKYGSTALIYASGGGHEAIVQLLLEAGADVNAHDNNSSTALINASIWSHEAIVQLLLKAGADVNAHEDKGSTALICASRWGYEAIVQLLLEAGADVNAHEDDGSTALIYASRWGREAIVQLLLEAGASRS